MADAQTAEVGTTEAGTRLRRAQRNHRCARVGLVVDQPHDLARQRRPQRHTWLHTPSLIITNESDEKKRSKLPQKDTPDLLFRFHDTKL
jgi:hypothetical protein